MSPSRLVAGAVACSLVLAGAALAQPPAAPGAADPLNADVPVPPARHHSALSGYRTAGPLPVQPWVASNQTVARIGGWRAYAREAAAPEPAASAASAAGGAPAGRPVP